MAKKKIYKFLAVWDNTGLESLFDLNKYETELDSWEKRKAWNTLKGDVLVEPKPRIPLQELIMRARYNSQRHYEIYTFTTTDGIDEKKVRTMFKECPQVMVDAIRASGNKIYSDRSTKEAVIV